MRRMRGVALGFVAAVLAIAGAPGKAPEAPPVEVTLKRTSYAELGDAVRGLKGKVVLVNFWADFCPPCKKEFPRLVALHNKHAAAGLAAVSACLPADPGDAAEEGRARKFLEAQRATCTNLLLAEAPAVWQAKLKIDGPPCVFLFDRRGKLRHRWNDGVDYDQVAARVAELMDEKP